MNALDIIHQVIKENKRSYLQTKVIAVSLTILTLIFLIIACFLLWIGDYLLQLAFQQSWNSLLLSTCKIFSIIVIIAIATTSAGVVYQFQTSLKRKRDKDFKSTVTAIAIVVTALSSQFIYACFMIVKDLIANANLELNLYDQPLERYGRRF